MKRNDAGGSGDGHSQDTSEGGGMSADEFVAVTKDAEKNCIISKSLGVLITSEAKFIG